MTTNSQVEMIMSEETKAELSEGLELAPIGARKKTTELEKANVSSIMQGHNGEHAAEISSIMQRGNGEHAGQISEESNREHAAETPSIMRADNGGQYNSVVLQIPSIMEASEEEHVGEISEESNREHAAETSSIMQKDDETSSIMQKDDETSSKGSIFRIPGLLKMQDEQAYTPFKFSFGPWHFGQTQLLCTGQKLKESFLEGLIKRLRGPAAKRQLKEAIKNVHGNARECYEGDMDVAEEKFEEILLLDGCFIIELFRKGAQEIVPPQNELALFSGGMIEVIYHDLLLLENQIPWFVLELLFDQTRDYPKCTDSTLVELASKFFGRAISHYEPREMPMLPMLQSKHDKNIIHLVDFVWHYLCFSSVTGEAATQLEYKTTIPSATRLKEAGVKFQKAESRNILNVRFNEGVLEIPPLLITPSTETIFRNLIIFEQYSHIGTPKVTSYAILLDSLVDTPDDVDLMSKAGIFSNWLNPEETAKFLNRVRNGTPIQAFFYAQLCKDVNRYCKRRWPKWRASLIHNYFTKPWAIVSVVFALIVLFFTIMQVFYK